MHTFYVPPTFICRKLWRVDNNESQSTFKVHDTHMQHVNTDTWKEMCFEAFLGYSIVRSEFNSHIVELRCDHFRHFGATKFAMQLRLRGKATPNLHIIVFANLEKTWLWQSPDFKVSDDWHWFLKNLSCFSPLYSSGSQTGINR